MPPVPDNHHRGPPSLSPSSRGPYAVSLLPLDCLLSPDHISCQLAWWCLCHLHVKVSCSTFLEPDFSYLEALAPYQPLAMKCIYCPIDTRLNFIQVSKLLKEVQVHLLCWSGVWMRLSVDQVCTAMM